MTIELKNEMKKRYNIIIDETGNNYRHDDEYGWAPVDNDMLFNALTPFRGLYEKQVKKERGIMASIHFSDLWDSMLHNNITGNMKDRDTQLNRILAIIH